MARKFQTTSDSQTHRFIPTLPGFGKRKNNSNRDKLLRRFAKHPATIGRNRKKHGRSV
jgi:hypothetical protein